MSDGTKLFRYTIPLDTTGSVDNPVYEPTYSGHVVKNHFQPQRLVIVQSEAVPHYHKDSVNITVDEINEDDLDVDVEIPDDSSNEESDGSTEDSDSDDEVDEEESDEVDEEEDEESDSSVSNMFTDTEDDEEETDE